MASKQHKSDRIGSGQDQNEGELNLCMKMFSFSDKDRSPGVISPVTPAKSNKDSVASWTSVSVTWNVEVCCTRAT